MNRYTPFFNDEQMTVGMGLDKDGSWVHIAAHEQALAEIERLRAEAEALLREGHEGGYFDASAGFYERIDAYLSRKGESHE